MAEKELGITFRSDQSFINKLISLSILTEVTGKERNRIYVAREIIATIQRDDDDGTNPYDDV
jgi:hypothetical protein